MKLFVEDLRFESAIFRTPLKFGASIVGELTVPMVTLRMTHQGHEGIGVGSMPLGNAWSFPEASHDQSLSAMRRLAEKMAGAIHGMEAGSSIFEVSHELENLALQLARQLSGEIASLQVAIPKLCALVVFSAFDIATFDAWGRMRHANTFSLLRSTPEAGDLSRWLDDDFKNFGLNQVICSIPAQSLPVFHLVGGLDPLTPSEVTRPVGDGLPEHLGAWIERDELTHFKIKLRGDDPDWDFERIVNVDRMGSTMVGERRNQEPIYSLDFNEKCASGVALVALLSRLKMESPRAFQRIAYVEQPTSRDLIDRPEDNMKEAAQLKPVVIDEALTDYDAFKRAKRLGYSGVALKACKGIGPSLLMAAACRKEKLFLCVQDLTCPGPAFLASASLAAWLGVEAIEANARQFCPQANEATARRYPEIFTIQSGRIQTQGLTEHGLGF